MCVALRQRGPALMDGTRGPQGLCSPCQQGPLLPRKNASAILSGSHPPYIMPPSLHYNKRINLPRICKAIGPGRGRGGVVGGQGDVVELSFPFSVHHVCFFPPPKSCHQSSTPLLGVAGAALVAAAALGNQKQICSHYGGPAVDLRCSVRSLRATGRDPASLAHFLLLRCANGAAA